MLYPSSCQSGYDNVRNPASGACRQGSNFVGRKGKKKNLKEKRIKEKEIWKKEENRKMAENFIKDIKIHTEY